MPARPAGRPNGESVPAPGAAAQLTVLRVPGPVVTLIEKEQSVIAPTSMYWLSQNRPPEGCWHLVVQPPVSVVVQFRSQLMLASTVQEPLQLSWHSVVQSVDPGCSWQCSVHWVSQLAEHSAEQESPVQLAMHPASQSVEQRSLQVKVAGMVVQAVLHLVSQVSVQVVAALAVHSAEQVDVKLTGTHCEVQPPAVSKWQVLGSMMVTTVPPLVVQVVAASALLAEKRGAARASAPKEALRKKRFMVRIL
jgi:hypothetical protein